MLIHWYSHDDRNSLHISYLLTQAGSALLETAVWGGDIGTVPICLLKFIGFFIYLWYIVLVAMTL